MLNKVMLIGNLGADPEVRVQESGTKRVGLRLATSERLYDRAAERYVDHTEWHDVVLWGAAADYADRYLHKGDRLYVEGRLRAREWTDRNGVVHAGVNILGNDLKLLSRRREAENTAADSTAGEAADSSADLLPPRPTDPDDLPF